MSHHQPYDSLSSQNRSPFINALNNISSPSSHGGQSGQGTLNQMTVKCHNKNGMLTTSSLNQLLWFLNCDKGEQGFSIPVLKRSYNRSWSTTHYYPPPIDLPCFPPSKKEGKKKIKMELAIFLERGDQIVAHSNVFNLWGFNASQ